jgi:hypothetical protein
MRVLAGMAFVVLSLLSVGPAALSEAQGGLTKRDAQGPVTVVVTLIPPATPGAPIKAKVVLDTHSAGLDGVAFEQAVAIRPLDGAEVPPTAVEQVSGSGHHREAVLVFPPSAQPGTVRIVVKNVGGVAERTFTWEPSTQ